ncbi:membrane protein insertase YidC [Gordonia pseudamarae]|uniref:Membrane protein insertase YidC n=1 Tax=Gordonia pseudamarae TaxID=2831662 RepID=A0ABX6IPN5_9ACTN|nr:MULTISPECIES: membrane protein insertase YidC [Gordonia]MBD0024203.1 membrane protein insertase YidC [Gordonia sp. (in: high G+C Gram-positive bacteria)]QHN28353.1 membrane protein insertase YidC [Gordonia pseudamarae]QHN37221.1 membrane protein insertase YidC [Gordonia pseudamarae]
MLNFIYWPVSWIMWVWHWLFDHLTPNTPGGDGIAWALSVVFLVFTLRAILYKPFVKQVRTTKKMQEINPQLQAIRKKYAKDRVKMTEEMQKLQKEHGFNPLLGCLPMFMQIPVFIGLFHVLRSFNRMGTGMGQLGMTAEETRRYGNYVFNADQVQNFLDARLFGVPLSSYVTQPTTEWVAFVSSLKPEDIDFTRGHIAILVVPMMIIASVSTHMNSRASVARQPAAALENPQTRIMNNLALYIFPLGILVTGVFFPVAILLYWMSNNIWTYGQQHIVFGQIEKEEEAARQAKQEKLKANAPKPGARPNRTKRAAAAPAKLDESSDSDSKPADSESSVDMSKPKPGRKPVKPQAGAKPTPGAKPAGSGNRKSGSSGKKPKGGAGGGKGGAAKRNRPGGK